MKKTLFILVYILSISAFNLAQNVSFKIIPIEYGTSNKAPIMFISGDILQIDCDTVFVVNKGRYNFYKNIHLALQNDNDSICGKLVKAYEFRLIDREISFQKIIENSRKSEKAALEMLEFTQGTLISTQKTLENTQLNLENTRRNLDIANENLKKARWNSVGNKILIGVGGAAIGLITGVLIMK